VQGLMHLFWTQEEISRRLEEIMGRTCDRVFELSNKTGLRPRMAALRIAIGRLADAKRALGLYP